MTIRISAGLLAVLLAFGSFAAAEEDVGGAKVGPGKAVLAASAKDGLRLSEPAIHRLGLVLQDARKGPIQELPTKSLVLTGEEVAVYRLRGGWFKRVEVRVLKRSPNSVRLELPGLEPGDRLVVAGAAFLRAAELDTLGVEEEENERH